MDKADGIIAGLRRLQRLGSPMDVGSTWLSSVFSGIDADLGLLAYYGPSGLLDHGERVQLCKCDAPGLAITRHACIAGQNIAIAVPPGAELFPLLVATKLLLGSLLEKVCRGPLQAEGHRTFHLASGAPILIVSPNVEMRSRYADTTIGQEPLLQKYPSYRLKPDGCSVRISKATQGIDVEEEQGLYFFLARQRVLPDQIQCAPAVVILDMLQGRWGARAPELIRWAAGLRDAGGGPSRLIAFVPLEDDACERAAAACALPIMPLDCEALFEAHEALGGNARPGPSARFTDKWSVQSTIAHPPQDRESAIVTIEGGSTLTDRLAAVEALMRPFRDLDQRDLRMVRWMLAIFAQLSCPLPWYEQASTGRTLRMVIDGLGRQGLDPGLRLAETLDAVRSHLDAVYGLLRLANPKSEALLAALPLAVSAGANDAPTGIVVRDRTMAEATRAWIYTEEKSLRERVVVLHAGGLDSDTYFGSLVLCGPWPARYRWQLAGGISRQITFLAYPGEDRIVDAQIERIVGRSSLLRRGNQREDAAARIRDPYADPAQSRDGDSLTSEALARVGGRQTVRRVFVWTTDAWVDSNGPGPASRIDDTPFYWSDPLEDADEPVETADDLMAVADAPGTTYVDAVELMLRSRASSAVAWMYLEPDRTSDVLVPEGEEFLPVKNRAIEPGMTLVGSDDGKRHSIFDQLLELAHATPELRPLKAMHENWVEAIGLCASRHRSARGTIDYPSLLSALRAEGVGIRDVQALRTWVTHGVLGPGDVNSIRAVGRVAGHPVLSASPELVDKALNGIRSVHQQVGRRLSAVLRASAAQAVSEVAPRASQRTKPMRSNSLSSNLALMVPLEEMIDAMEFWTVDNVERAQCPQVPSVLLGRYLPGRWKTHAGHRTSGE